MLAWKRELKNVMDNPDYMEWQMRDIKENLKREHPDTHLLRESIKHMREWTHKIDLAHKREWTHKIDLAHNRAREGLKKVI